MGFPGRERKRRRRNLVTQDARRNGEETRDERWKRGNAT